MFGYCEDLVQDAFLSFYRNIEKYKELQDVEIRNLLCRIVLNKCKDYYKSAYTRYVTSTDTILDFETEVEAEESLFDNERKMYIKRMVNELKEPYKTLIIERYIKERSLDEIAEKMGSSKEVVKTQLYRAKNILKENLKGGENFYG